MELERRIAWEEERRRRRGEINAAARSGDSDLLAEAIAQYLIAFNSEDRPHAILTVLNRCANSDAWRAIHSHWDGFDLVPHREFATLFSRLRGSWRPEFWGAPDRKLYESLPERFIIYRGHSAAARIGLSWTLDRDTAAQFARGHRGLRNKHPSIVIAEVSKRNVAGAYNGREEREIVLFSPSRRPSDDSSPCSRVKSSDPSILPTLLDCSGLHVNASIAAIRGRGARTDN
jgi:hypothetical protein